jgi:CheY-like chemotaxis protein
MAHIVIVDPNQSIRKLLGYIVSLLDWTSYLAASGREVWQLIEKTPPDLIIAEVDLNKMSGIELVWNMSQNRMLAHIPVILMGSPYQENDRCLQDAPLLSLSLFLWKSFFSYYLT